MELDKKTIKKIIFIIFVAILLFYGLNNFGIIVGLAGKGINLCFPFILGCAIAFIINVPMSKLEGLLFKKAKGERLKKAARPISLVLTLIIVVAVLAGAVLIVVPEIGATAKNLINQIPGAWENFLNWLEGTPLNGQLIQRYEKEIESIWNNISDTVISLLKNSAMGALNTGIGVVSGLISGVANFLIAFIFAIYILLQKERLAYQLVRLMKTVFSQETVDRTIEIGKLTSSTFANFLTGQCLEACILGTMFFVVLTVLGLPYGLLIGILIGFTALIPIVGAFIGCIVGAFLIVIVSPVKALIFIIVFLILQQIEGNLIYPHVVGNSVGLPSIWVLVAVTVGSKVMGITGMILFIPIFSVAYALLRNFVNKKEELRAINEKMQQENSDQIEKIEEVENEPIDN